MKYVAVFTGLYFCCLLQVLGGGGGGNVQAPFQSKTSTQFKQCSGGCFFALRFSFTSGNSSLNLNLKWFF